MRTIAGILPWAVVSAVVGGATFWLLSGDMAAGRWLLAAILVGHAVVHLFFALPAPAATTESDWPFDLATSWAVTRFGADPRTVRIAGMALIAVVVIGSALSALATVGILVPASWWPATVLGLAGSSAVLLLLFLDRRLVIGFAIDAILVWLVVSRVWTP